MIFLSYSLNRSDRRGVYQFTRSLVESVKKNNYYTGVFSQLYSRDFDKNELLSYFYDPNKYFFIKNNKLEIIYKYLLNKAYNQKILFLKNSVKLDKNNISLNEIDFFLNEELFYYSNNMDLIFSKSLYLRNIVLPEFSSRDIIFTDSPLAFRSTKHKMIQTVHDTIPLDEKRKYYQYFYKRLEACCYADKILAVSNHTKNQFLEYFPTMHDRVEVVYQPLPADEHSMYLSSLPEVQEDVLKKYNLKAKQYMYYVGAIEERKNIHNLIDAYIKSTNNDKTIPLVISGSINQQYSNKFNLNDFLINKDEYTYSKNNILKTDFVSDVEKLCLIRNSRAFLFPTLNEGFGIPVIEAQTLGIPVLTSNNSSLPEVTNGSALMLENPLNIDEIVESIKKLWTDDELCTELSQKGLINVERFSKENFQNSIGHFLSNI